jgi:hypothetical protein
LAAQTALCSAAEKVGWKVEQTAEQTGESLVAGMAGRWECLKAGSLVGCSAALSASTWAVAWVFQRAEQRGLNSVAAREIL